jgi:6-phosphogluconolactonase
MHTLIAGSRVSSDTQGITFCSFDEQTGFIQYLTGFGGVEQPTFQCFDGERHILYTVSETENDGHVYGFRVSPSLTCEQMFCVRSLGGSPCHLALNPSGDSLAVANYATGTFTCFRFNECNYTENFAEREHTLYARRKATSTAACGRMKVHQSWSPTWDSTG